MTSALYFLPLATTAAHVGSAALQQVAAGVTAAGTSFADMLAGKSSEDEKKIDDAVKEPGDATAMLALIGQIQSGLQNMLQSLGLNLKGELTLSIDDTGKVQVAGDSDSAAVLEQVINSDPTLQAKMGALKRAARSSGDADRFEAKLRYEQGRVQLEVQEEPLAAEAK